MAADHVGPTAGLTVYPAWDLACPPIPPRSVLYRVPPIGLGTPDVESLTGYLARLAEAHGVSTRTLMVQVVLPLGGRTHLTKPFDNSLSAFWARAAHCFNGTGRLARDGVQAVAQLTGQPDLAALTCLPSGSFEAAGPGARPAIRGGATPARSSTNHCVGRWP